MILMGGDGLLATNLQSFDVAFLCPHGNGPQAVSTLVDNALQKQTHVEKT